MIDALETAIATVRGMTPRSFNAVKRGGHSQVLYILHGDGCGRLIALNRNYKPLGYTKQKYVNYAAPEYAGLRCVDRTGAIRALATKINDHGRTAYPSGKRVPILAFLADDDTIGTYCARVGRLIEVLR